jgi:hypothetical protein
MRIDDRSTAGGRVGYATFTVARVNVARRKMRANVEP